MEQKIVVVNRKTQTHATKDCVLWCWECLARNFFFHLMTNT